MLQRRYKVSVRSCLVKCSEIDLASEMKEEERDESELLPSPVHKVRGNSEATMTTEGEVRSDVQVTASVRTEIREARMRRVETREAEETRNSLRESFV